MRGLRITIPAILFAVFIVGCIVQADTYSDQSPFSAPDTLQSSDDNGSATATPIPPNATTGPTPTATCESSLTSEECDRQQGRQQSQKARERDDYDASISATLESSGRSD
ncbi:MAG: hypothetical protein OXI80_18895 [Caldilineaceae bacterium]|nr:hypothetical protein [Caldilineaceae bacterium]MDE0339748.1 hypothetical protein [Caldilineaceae bacterium]